MIKSQKVTKGNVKTSRVAYFLNAFPRLSETFVLNEILQLRIQGVNVQIYSMARTCEDIVHEDAIPLLKGTVYVCEIERKVKLRCFLRLLLRHPLRLFKTVLFVRGKKDKRLLWSLKQAIYLAAESRRLRVEHIHAHFALEAAEHAMLTGMLTGIPYSIAAHAIDIYVLQRMLREKMNGAKFLVTESAYNKQYLLKYNEGFPEERIHIIRLGVDPDAFAFNDKRARREHLNGTMHILSVARLVEKKGLAYLIDALGLLRSEQLKTKVTIVGDGPERKSLMGLIHRYGLESLVHLVGAKDGDQVKALLGEADVFVLPCIIAQNGDRDGTPTALVEAMAMGIPVISTTVAGIPEIVPETAGILVPPKDSSALARAIETVYRVGSTVREEMGRHGREYVTKHLNLQSETRKLVELFLAPHESAR